MLAWPVRHYQRLVRSRFARLLTLGAHEAQDAATVRDRLRRGGLTATALADFVGFARTLGFGDEDLRGALALANGMAVQCEAPTGRAEMLVAASLLLAWSGQRVHLLASDDEAAAGLHAALAEPLEQQGVDVACLQHGLPAAERRRAYCASVVVASGREVLRDYLEDRLAVRTARGEIGRKLSRLAGGNSMAAARMRGLPFGIVVDGNEVLVEQACSPLTLVGQADPGDERSWTGIALHLAQSLSEGVHFLRRDDGSAELTDAGEFELSHRSHSLPGHWRNSARRSANVTLALLALGLRAGEDYRIVEGRVQLAPVHERIHGLKQLLEVREGLAVTGRALVRGKLTYQRFFRRYRGLAAVCGDTRHIGGELWYIYGMPCFTLTEPDVAEAVPVELTPAEQRAVAQAQRVGIGEGLRRVLTARRRRRERRDAEHLRRSLLHLDNQAGTVTAFMGRSE